MECLLAIAPVCFPQGQNNEWLTAGADSAVVATLVRRRGPGSTRRKAWRQSWRLLNVTRDNYQTSGPIFAVEDTKTIVRRKGRCSACLYIFARPVVSTCLVAA
jgi:hypothetical protein